MGCGACMDLWESGTAQPCRLCPSVQGMQERSVEQLQHAGGPTGQFIPEHAPPGCSTLLPGLGGYQISEIRWLTPGVLPARRCD